MIDMILFLHDYVRFSLYISPFLSFSRKASRDRESAQRAAAERVAAQTRVEGLNLETLSLMKKLREREARVRQLRLRRGEVGRAARQTITLGALFLAKVRALHAARKSSAELGIDQLLMHDLTAAPAVAAKCVGPPGLPLTATEKKSEGIYFSFF